MPAADVPRRLALTALIVPDYDEAIAFYRDALGFEVVEDTPLAPGKRWVVIRQRGGGNALLLARATTAAQREAVGRQGAGRVWLFLHTADFDTDHAHLARCEGVRFVETPRDEAYGRVAVFEDRYGNLWDLIQPRGGLDADGAPT
jgi:catechol 2,3-dioxygenase-like lactoylglutathione lyase family enzyme